MSTTLNVHDVTVTSAEAARLSVGSTEVYTLVLNMLSGKEPAEIVLFLAGPAELPEAARRLQEAADQCEALYLAHNPTPGAAQWERLRIQGIRAGLPCVIQEDGTLLPADMAAVKDNPEEIDRRIAAAEPR